MEVNHTQRLIDYLDIAKTPHAGAAEREKLQKDFKTFYSQYDKRRGKDFEKTFPIIGEWYRGIWVWGKRAWKIKNKRYDS